MYTGRLCHTTYHLPLLIFALSTTVESTVLYHHRQLHRSIVVGSYFYIDGGEIVTWNGSGNGVQAGYGVQSGNDYNQTNLGNITVNANNFTYSIDLTQSWTNATVSLNPITKPQDTIVNQQALWTDASDGSFYSYDGGVSWAYFPRPAPPVNSFWKFTPSGNSGQWSEVYAGAQSTFSSLQRTFGGAYSSGNGLGFVLGGQINGQTTYTNTYQYPPGVVVYNSSSQQWSNDSSLAYSNGGSSYGGAAKFVPSFGPNGLLFILGGAIYSSGSNAQVEVDASVVHMYEPESQQWKSQVSTGDVPPPMQKQCVVGAQGENGTYEFFLYGGWSSTNISAIIQLGNVYVLSVPGFVWRVSNGTTPYGRYDHACSPYGRYMIVAGGSVSTYSDAEANKGHIFNSIVDPWPQGIGVFDMNEMTWASSFDPTASPYKTPQVITDYYTANGRYPSSLTSDPVLSSWFVHSTNSSTTSTNPSQPNASSTQSKSQKSSTGVIVGAVVAGILALLILGFASWWFFLRKRKPHYSHNRDVSDKQELANITKVYQQPELATPLGGGKHELGGSDNHNSGGVKFLRNSRIELPAQRESQYQEVYEM